MNFNFHKTVVFVLVFSNAVLSDQHQRNVPDKEHVPALFDAVQK